MLDSAEVIAAFAEDMNAYLRESELTESRAFVRSFAKDVAVAPGKATIRYTIPMPQDSPIPGQDSENLTLPSAVLPNAEAWYPREDSNLCLRLRRPTLYPLSYGGPQGAIVAPGGRCRIPLDRSGESARIDRHLPPDLAKEPRPMPIYEFRCPSCGNVFERKRPVQKASQGARCPDDSKMAQRIFGAAIIGVGSGGDDFGDLGDLGGMPGMGGGMPDMGGGMPGMGGGMPGMDGLDMGGDLDF